MVTAAYSELLPLDSFSPYHCNARTTLAGVLRSHDPCVATGGKCSWRLLGAPFERHHNSSLVSYPLPDRPCRLVLYLLAQRAMSIRYASSNEQLETRPDQGTLVSMRNLALRSPLRARSLARLSILPGDPRESHSGERHPPLSPLFFFSLSLAGSCGSVYYFVFRFCSLLRGRLLGCAAGVVLLRLLLPFSAVNEDRVSAAAFFVKYGFHRTAGVPPLSLPNRSLASLSGVEFSPTLRPPQLFISLLSSFTRRFSFFSIL